MNNEEYVEYLKAKSHLMLKEKVFSYEAASRYLKYSKSEIILKIKYALIMFPISDGISLSLFWNIKNTVLPANNIYGGYARNIPIEKIRENEQDFLEKMIEESRELVGASIMALSSQNFLYVAKENGLPIEFDSEEEQS